MHDNRTGPSSSSSTLCACLLLTVWKGDLTTISHPHCGLVASYSQSASCSNSDCVCEAQVSVSVGTTSDIGPDAHLLVVTVQAPFCLRTALLPAGHRRAPRPCSSEIMYTRVIYGLRCCADEVSADNNSLWSVLAHVRISCKRSCILATSPRAAWSMRSPTLSSHRFFITASIAPTSSTARCALVTTSASDQIATSMAPTVRMPTLATIEDVPRLDTPDLGRPFAMHTGYELEVKVSQVPGYPDTPGRPLCSTSRHIKHQRMQSAFEKSSSTRRLRRVRAFSPSEDSLSAFSPTVAIEVSKEDWLEDAIAKTKAIMLDMENVEGLARRFSLSSLDPLDTCSDCDSWSLLDCDSPPNPNVLHRKNGLKDLRSQYAASESEDEVRQNLSTRASSDMSAASSFWSSASEDSTASSKDTVIWRDVFCLCRRSYHPAHGAMIACSLCDRSYHLRCVGLQHLQASNYNEESFICPRCEEAAFRQMADEEEQTNMAS